MAENVFEVRGHLLDRGIMKQVLDTITDQGGRYVVEEFVAGEKREDESYARLAVTADEEAMTVILDNLIDLGCRIIPADENLEGLLQPSEQDGTAPDGFYSTTNHPTFVRLGRQWVRVKDQRMDACIVVEGRVARCVRLRDIKKGDMVVCTQAGIKVVPPEDKRDRKAFAFMTNRVSSERRVQTVVRDLARDMRDLRERGGKTVVVVGPAVIHTGGAPALGDIIRKGYISALLAGNALAVHDIEAALYGTSLGVDMDTGNVVYEGHKNHMRAINDIRRAGGLAEAVQQGLLKRGVMFECIRKGIPYVLAGSIRDDGPLPETIMDLIEAQNRYAEVLRGADLVVMLASMLHAIGTANMLPSWVKTICVDINPAVVSKLVDRGSAQAHGIVTDVGLFLYLLNSELP